MKNQRRLFLNQAVLMAGAATLSKPLSSIGAISKRINTWHAAANGVTIYHTNDMHGHINAAYHNMGGLGQIKMLLKIQPTSGLLLDGGDFLDQDNSAAQQKEMIYTMNTMGYHAAAIGNHELANGQDHLATLVPLMQFSLVNCNYQFNNKLSPLVKPYIIMKSGKYRVGITGIGHKVNGVIYNDPILCANLTARLLKEKENCDLVICLSHLGYKQEGNKPDNRILAHESEYIDMIISGHNRTLLSGQMVLLNKLNHEVIVSHAAWNGLMVGKTVFSFANGKQKTGLDAQYLVPGQPYGQSFSEAYKQLKSA